MTPEENYRLPFMLNSMAIPIFPPTSHRLSRVWPARHLFVLLLAAVVLASGLAVTRVQAGSLTTLHSFNGPPNGISPSAGLVRGPGGNLYGTTSSGGLSDGGTVFSITPAGVLTTLFNFSSGSSPNAELLVGSDGKLYGTTAGGGARGGGTVFAITPTGVLTTLYSFTGGTDGGDPEAGLAVGANGNFYGTTRRGGTSNGGTAFAITPAGVLTTIHLFNANEGANPARLALGQDGNFYGVARLGGANNQGTLFRLTPAGGLTVLHVFDDGTNGSYPSSALTQGSDGNFYGTATRGGDGLYGTIFRLTLAGQLTTLHTFTGGANGGLPYAGLAVGLDGNFYGVTQVLGGNGYGTIYRFNATGGLTTIHSFAVNTEGNSASTTLALGQDGNFYGVARQAGSFGYGTVFSATPAGAVTVLYNFRRSADGVIPTAGLVQGSDGNFYGTTNLDGLYNYGTIFRMNAAGELTTLHSFANATDGGYPNASLVQGADGNLYGTTPQGGAGGGGTVFRITPGGVLTTLHSFSGNADDGYTPVGALVLGRDGNFYGATRSGPNSTPGAIFRLTPAGDLTTPYTFTASSYNGLTGLTLGSDGNFYGTTGIGANNRGSIFRYTPGGVATTLYNFVAGSGTRPSALVLGSDGSFYGTTSSSDSPGSSGTVFRFTPAIGKTNRQGLPVKDGVKSEIQPNADSGTLVTLYNFNTATDGSFPPANPLIQGRDGSFYGTLGQGGTGGSGTVYRITSAGVLSILRSFGGTDGGSPLGTLCQGLDGRLYGTTQQGGANGRGVVYRLRVPQASSQP